MLEIKYLEATGILIAWAGSPEHEGGHLEAQSGEQIAVIDCPVPEKPPSAWLYDESTQSLIPNPDYIEPYDPNPDRIRLQELLATSPAVITMPEIWEALRILARLHGLPS